MVDRKKWQAADKALLETLIDLSLRGFLGNAPVDKNLVDAIIAGLLDRGHDVVADEDSIR